MEIFDVIVFMIFHDHLTEHYVLAENSIMFAFSDIILHPLWWKYSLHCLCENFEDIDREIKETNLN